MRCYRYMDFKYGLQSFETGLFKVTKPNDFNDPYDCYGLVTGELRKEVFEEHVRTNFNRLCEGYDKASDIPADVFSSPEKMIEWYGPRFGKLAHEQMLYRRIYDEKIRVLCLVGKDGLTPESDALMWSHYAHGGHGVRIELEIQEEGPGLAYGLRHVKYQDEVPRLDLSKVNHWPDEELYPTFFSDCIWTKGRTWAYENEVRLICSPEYPIKVVSAVKCDDGVVRDFGGFSRSAIKGLVFGPKVRPEIWIDHYTHYCKMGLDDGVVFERAVLETDRYCYGYENLEKSMWQVFDELMDWRKKHPDRGVKSGKECP